jgi:hypothetical protein
VPKPLKAAAVEAADAAAGAAVAGAEAATLGAPNEAPNVTPVPKPEFKNGAVMKASLVNSVHTYQDRIVVGSRDFSLDKVGSVHKPNDGQHDRKHSGPPIDGAAALGVDVFGALAPKRPPEEKPIPVEEEAALLEPKARALLAPKLKLEVPAKFQEAG